MSDEEAWEPLTMVDYLMLGIVGTFQAFALGVCVHLFVWRKWPPYVTKNVEIVIIMVSGVVAGFHARTKIASTSAPGAHARWVRVDICGRSGKWSNPEE
ncbi:unnamed protein product, partial [Ectocarpus fasciculatus]